MAGTTMIYLTTASRTRLKALAYLDDRTLTAYLEVVSRDLVAKVPAKVYRNAVEAVSDGNPENA